MKAKRNVIIVFSLLMISSYIKDQKHEAEPSTINSLAHASKDLSFYMSDIVTGSIVELGEEVVPNIDHRMATQLSNPNKDNQENWYDSVPVILPAMVKDMDK